MKYILAFFGGLRNHFYDLLTATAFLLLIFCAVYGKALGFLIGFMVLALVLAVRKLHQIYGITSYHALITQNSQTEKPKNQNP